MSRRPAVALAAVAAVAAVLAGCSGPRSGTSVSSAIGGCASVLPVSRAALPGPARLVSVHALRRGDAARYLREVGAVPSPPSGTAVPDPLTSDAPSAGAPSTDQPQDPVPGRRPGSPSPTPGPLLAPTPTPTQGNGPRGCVLVFRGPFPQGVPLAPAGTSGEYALVFADVRHPQVRRVVLTSQLPPDLRHS